MASPKCAFIGSGNVAWHLSQALEIAGYPVVEVYSRNQTHAQRLASQLYDTSVLDSLDFSGSKARLFFLAVSDDALADVAAELTVPPGSIVVHTSGSQSLEVLQNVLRNLEDVQPGVFYPLQTFSKSKAVSFANIPLCIEAPDAETEGLLVTIGQQMSRTVYLVSSEERRVLHVAAVVACNFTNHLLAVAKHMLDREALEFVLLKPIIEETIAKALRADDPAEVQTGPASRNDSQVIQQHLQYLQPYPEEQAIYRLLTSSILRQNQGK